jgi:hypothetical protein
LRNRCIRRERVDACDRYAGIACQLEQAGDPPDGTLGIWDNSASTLLREVVVHVDHE